MRKKDREGDRELSEFEMQEGERTLSWSPLNRARNEAWVPVVPLTPLNPISSLALTKFLKSQSNSYHQLNARRAKAIDCPLKRGGREGVLEATTSHAFRQ